MISISKRLLLGLTVASFSAHSPLVLAQQLNVIKGSSSNLEAYRIYSSGQDSLLSGDINTHIPLQNVAEIGKLVEVGIGNENGQQLKDYWYKNKGGSLSKVLTNDSGNIVGTLALSSNGVISVSLDVDGDHDIDLMRVISPDRDILIASEARGLDFLTRELKELSSCIESGQSSEDVDARAQFTLPGCSDKSLNNPDGVGSVGIGGLEQEFDNGSTTSLPTRDCGNPVGILTGPPTVEGLIERFFWEQVKKRGARVLGPVGWVWEILFNPSVAKAPNYPVPEFEMDIGNVEVEPLESESEDTESPNDASPLEEDNDETTPTDDGNTTSDGEPTPEEGSSTTGSPIPGGDVGPGIGSGSPKPGLGGCWSQNLSYLQNALLNARSAEDLEDKALQTDCLEPLVNPGAQRYKGGDLANISCQRQVDGSSKNPSIILQIPGEECKPTGLTRVGVCDGNGAGRSPFSSRRIDVRYTDLVEAIYGIETACDPRICDPGN